MSDTRSFEEVAERDGKGTDVMAKKIGFTAAQAAALYKLATADAPVSSWEFGAGTVAWMRRNGYVANETSTGAVRLVLTAGGRAAVGGAS